MRTRHVVGLVLSALAVIPLAGCQAGTGLQQTPGAAIGSASETLLAAAERTKRVDLSFALRADYNAATGVYQASTRAARVLNNGVEDLVFVATPTVTYARGMIQPADLFFRMDASRMAATCDVAVAASPLMGLDLLGQLTSAEQVGDLDYSGTFDLTKVTGSVATLKTAEYLSYGLEADRTAIPFTATLDRSGYIAAFTMSIDRLGVHFVYDMRLSNFGVAVKVPIPTNAAEAPPEMYR